MEIIERLRAIMAETQGAFTMLEFGACDGYHTAMFLQMLEARGKPYELNAFEPEPRNFLICQDRTKKTAKNGKLILWNAAVGATNGVVPFYVSNTNYYGSSSLRAPKLALQAWPEMRFDKTISVQSMTLDDLCQRRTSPIDFIWADIQGAQGDLIKGGLNTWPRVRYLFVEYDNSELYEGEVLGVSPLLEMLPGFEIVEDYGGDVLLKNKEIIS